MEQDIKDFLRWNQIAESIRSLTPAFADVRFRFSGELAFYAVDRDELELDDLDVARTGPK